MRISKNAYRDMCSEKMRNLTVRIDEETYRHIEETASAENVDRSTATRQLLKKGINEEKKKRALDHYRLGKIPLWRAAQLAECPFLLFLVYSFFEELAGCGGS